MLVNDGNFAAKCVRDLKKKTKRKTDLYHQQQIFRHCYISDGNVKEIKNKKEKLDLNY